MATKADYVRFHKLRADLAKVMGEVQEQEIALHMKYGSRPQASWMTAAERKKSQSLFAKSDKLRNSILAIIDRVSPRDWNRGVSAHWIATELPWEDVITTGPLTHKPIASWGTTDAELRSLVERPNRSGGRSRTKTRR